MFTKHNFFGFTCFVVFAYIAAQFTANKLYNTLVGNVNLNNPKMYNNMSEPGYEGDKSGMPLPGQEQNPPPYSQPRMGPVQPMQQQPMQQQPGHMHSSNTNTTVVIQQQPAQVVIQGSRAWSTGICSCFDDCGVCLLGLFCPCIHGCIVSGNAGECCCVAHMCPIALRTKIRTRHNIAGSIVDDCCTLACCGPCAMCQMARELNIHGI